MEQAVLTNWPIISIAWDPVRRHLLAGGSGFLVSFDPATEVVRVLSQDHIVTGIIPYGEEAIFSCRNAKAEGNFYKVRLEDGTITRYGPEISFKRSCFYFSQCPAGLLYSDSAKDSVVLMVRQNESKALYQGERVKGEQIVVCPMGVIEWQGQIYVADSFSRISVISDGGSRPALEKYDGKMLKYPTAIRKFDEDRLMVCDSRNRRILVCRAQDARLEVQFAIQTQHPPEDAVALGSQVVYCSPHERMLQVVSLS